jgi:two-component system, OmpR family, response regulator
MRWIVILGLAIILAGILCTPVAGAEPLPVYEKNLQIHLNYHDNVYSVSSMEVRYGKSPNLNIRSGNLKGEILDTDGKVLKSFSLQDPGVAYGDILGPPGDDSLIGYTQVPASGEMFVTIPYLQGMQKFSLSDSRDGTLLVSASLNPPIASFCTDYSNDPDCISRIVPVKSAIPDSGMYPALALIFSASVIIAVGMAFLTIRSKTKEQTQKKQVILIVDDDPDIVNIFDILLDKKGYATITASGGKECLDILKKQIPDLILLDVLMEPMDGWQTLEQIKKNPESKPIPVLMVTGKRLTVNEAKQYHISIDDYIMKPIQPAELYAAVDTILERKQKLKETLVLAKQAGVDKDKFCEFANLTRRISVNKKILNILNIPQGIPTQTDLDTLDDMLFVDYMNVKTGFHEKRAAQLRQEINTSFRSKGFPELTL